MKKELLNIYSNQTYGNKTWEDTNKNLIEPSFLGDDKPGWKFILGACLLTILFSIVAPWWTLAILLFILTISS